MRREASETGKEEKSFSTEDWVDLVTHSDTRGRFHDCLLSMEENESFYLLSALANMTVAREPSESQFIQVLVYIFLPDTILIVCEIYVHCWLYCTSSSSEGTPMCHSLSVKR